MSGTDRRLSPALELSIYRVVQEALTGQLNPADNEMIKIGLWLELDVGLGFMVGLGLGSLIGQRTVPIVLLVVLEIIVTPILAGHVIPYFLDGQRLVVGLAMDQLRPAGLAGAGRPRPRALRRTWIAGDTADAHVGDDLRHRRLDRRLVGDRRLADDDPRRVTSM